ncbi:MAG: exosortase C-terminal domain/associated protein EpsI [Candidatus Thiodiazotropha sp.]
MYKPVSNTFIIHDLSLFLGIALLIILFKSTAVSIYYNWTAEDSPYSHGLLLLPISLYLMLHEWKLKRYESNIQFRPFPSLILILLSVLWYLSESVNIQITSQILFIIIISFYIYSLFGFRQSLRISFPILILLSSVPLWFIFSEPLQIPTAILVDKLLKITGYTSFRESYFIHIPEGIFEVGDTCSGLRYQIAAITTAALYVFYYKYKLVASVLFVFIASLIAFLSNSVRIYIVVLSGHYTNMTHSLLEDHIWLGWAVFGAFFLAYLFILGRTDKNNYTVVSVLDDPAHTNISDNNTTKVILISITLIGLASVGPLSVRHFSTSSSSTVYREAMNFELNIDGWKRTKTTQQWKPNWQPSDYELLASYSNKVGQVDIFMSTFFNQAQGKELINDLNYPYETKDWKLEKTSVVDIKLETGNAYTITESIVINKYKQKRIIWNWYYINEKLTHDKLNAKLFSILNSFSGRKDETVFIISSNLNVDIDNTRRLLKGFFIDGFFHYQIQLDKLNK